METETTTIETDVMPDEDPRSSLKETVTTTHISTERDNSTFSSVYKAASLLAAYETWVGSHTGLARNVETALYVVPQLVPVREWIKRRINRFCVYVDWIFSNDNFTKCECARNVRWSQK